VTNLDTKQTTLLDQVKLQKAEFDVREADLREQLEHDLAQARRDLVTAVVVAYEAGVPKRRLHIEGLGTKDAKGLADMLEASASTILPGKAVAGVRQVGEVYIVTDSKGQEWEFWPVDLGDSVMVERSEQTPYAAKTAGLTVTPEVYTLLRKQFPKADMSTFLENGDSND